MTQPSYALTRGQRGPRRPCPYVTRAARETKFSTIYRTHRISFGVRSQSFLNLKF
ncbi:hypothetical protein HanRHA438_Chr12g0555481 [Helianthus annuus]|nr:hypothetical protein HanRHA438_Chr12g0555481 [Helianthus annuus]